MSFFRRFKPRSGSQSLLRWALTVCLLGVALFWGFDHFGDYPKLDDPDFYYHLAVAKRTAAQGLVRSLPEVEDIGWNHYFPDKDFLFHQALGLADRIAGESGAQSMRVVLALLLIGTLLVFGARRLPPLLVALTLISTVFMNPRFLSRLYDLRPYVLAETCFVLVIYGLLLRNRVLVFFGAVFYTLGYSAFFLPLATVLMFFLLCRKSAATTLKLTLWGVFGFTLGILIHPYFPSNLVMSFRTIEIATRVSEWGRVASGQELEVLPGGVFFKENGLLIMATLLCGWSNRLRSRPHLWLFLMTAGFWLLCRINGKAIEYAVPLTVILILETLSHSVSQKNLWKVSLAGFGTLILLQVPILLEGANAPKAMAADRALKALRALPSNADGKKLFSCEWGNESYLLYARPGVRMVDILDPFYLLSEAPQKLELRNRFKQGAIADPRRMLKDVFHADYVMCGAEAATLSLEHDPGFIKLSANANQGAREGEFSLYQIRDTASAEFVRHFTLQPGNQPVSLIEPDGKEPRSILTRATLPQELSSSCLEVAVSTEEIRRLQGARYLALGGGPTIEVRRNHQLLMQFDRSQLRPGLFTHAAELVPPLRVNDRLTAKVCSEADFKSQSIAISLWNELPADFKMREPAPGHP